MAQIVDPKIDAWLAQADEDRYWLLARRDHTTCDLTATEKTEMRRLARQLGFQ